MIYILIKVRCVPCSLSECYYSSNINKYIFGSGLAMVSLSLLPLWLSFTPDNYQWMPFASCAGLLFVASTPSFMDTLQKPVHYTAAVLCCLSALAWQYLLGHTVIPTIYLLIVLWCTIFNQKAWCWWLECAVIASLMTCLWLDYLCKQPFLNN